MKKLLCITLLIALAGRAYPAYTSVKWLPDSMEDAYYGDETVIEEKFPDNVEMSARYKVYYFRKKGFIVNGPAVQYTEMKIKVKAGGKTLGFNWIVPYYCLEGFGHEEMPKGAVFYKNKIYIETWKTPCGNTDVHMWERTVFRGNPRIIAGYFTYGGEKPKSGRKDLPFYYHWDKVYEWDAVTAAEYEEAINNGDLLILHGAEYAAAKADYLKQFRGHIKDGSPRALFFDAIKENNHEAAKALLERDPGLVRITDDRLNTALHIDLEYNLGGKIYLLLLQYKADVNAVNIMGETPLQKAVQWHQDEAIRALLAKGARIPYPAPGFLANYMKLPVWKLLPVEAVNYKNPQKNGWAGDEAFQVWGYDPPGKFKSGIGAPDGNEYKAIKDARTKMLIAFGLPTVGENETALEKAETLKGLKKDLFIAACSGQPVITRNIRYSIYEQRPGEKKYGMHVLYRVYRPGLKMLVKKAGVKVKIPAEEARVKPQPTVHINSEQGGH